MWAGYWLCSSFFFSSWGDNMWNFAVGLYLVKLTPGSLQLTAIYGAVVTSSVILFAPIIGNWIDRKNRLVVIRTLLLLQNGLIICSAVFISLILFRVTANNNILTLFKVLVIIFGAAANLASQGEQISITRDWVVVICHNDNDILAKLNAHMRRIDLSVAILAPIAVGSLMSLISDLSGIALICGWNILSMFSEYIQLHHIYKTAPELTEKHINEYEPIGEIDNDHKINLTWLGIFDRIKLSFIGWKVYKSQSIYLAGIALAVLYLTVLGFSSITVGYAYSQSMKEVYVSIFFGTGALFGILGTIVFPFLRNKVGLVKTGIIGLGYQCSMLIICVASIWAPGSPSSLKYLKRNITDINSTFINNNVMSYHKSVTTHSPIIIYHSYVSILLLMLGVVLSRSGLWISDLTITQLQQENVEEEFRGAVGGVQSSLNSILDLMQYILTIVFFKPADFGILILISFSAVFTSFLLYITFSIKTHVLSKKM
ncbi:solute carrier family 40 member 1-like isoform X1 [Hydra vulgaris]|uniref:solute carrier family 40 member 1-like isoform X1 n=1 Tax=Hydra vulgaris TaxID=6087 RepID=UPI001F5F418F|nr:solute carrier family 40 member 1-like [Hydra vulgaris]